MNIAPLTLHWPRCIASLLALTALVPLFVLRHEALAGGGCPVDCPSGAILENDACGGWPDLNAGCAALPPSFQDIPLGATVCGTVGGLTLGAVTGRDVDWFRFTVTTPTVVRLEITHESSVTGNPVSNLLVGIASSDVCGSQYFFSYDAGGACPFVTPSVALLPGEYAFLLSVNSFGPDVPDSVCPVAYVATLVDGGGEEVCGESNPQDCFEAGGAPGCNDFACCSAVCAVDSFCCTVQWDASCAATACELPACAGVDCVERMNWKLEQFDTIRARNYLKTLPGQTLTDQELRELYSQNTLMLTLLSSMLEQVPNQGLQNSRGDCPNSCDGLDLPRIKAKIEKLQVLQLFILEKNEYLITQPGLSELERAIIEALITSFYVSQGELADLLAQQLNPCPWDLNEDGTVDAADLGIVIGAWGSAGPGDFDESGLVDATDLAILLGAWGVMCEA